MLTMSARLFISIILVIFSYAALAGNLAAEEIVLTDKEKAFILAHPEITLGGGVSFEPFLVKNSNGTISGYDVDIANLIKKKSGLNIKFKLGKWKEVQEEAKNRTVDGLSTASRQKSRDAYMDASIPYMQTTSFVIVKHGNPQRIFSTNDMQGKRVALQEGNVLFEGIVAPYLDKIEVVYYDTIFEVIRSVASGETDFTIMDETAFYVAGNLGFGSFIEGVFPIGEPFDVVFYTRNDWPELASIVDKVLKGISEQEKYSIRNKWFSKVKENAINPKQILFTAEENEYLAKKGTIYIAANPSHMPYEGIDELGRLDGMSRDYLKMFESHITADFKLLPSKRMEDSFGLVQNGKADALLFAENRKGLDEYMDFTTPFLSFPYVVATTNDKSYFDDIERVLEHTFVVLKDAPVVEKISKLYPTIKLIEVDTLKQGITKLRKGEAFGFIETSALIGYVIQKELMLDIKISGHTGVNLDFFVATKKDEPLLGVVFQKVVGGLSERDKREVYNHWIAIRYEKGVDYTILWKTILFSIVVLSATLVWNRQLTRAKNRTLQALDELHATQNALHKRNEELQHLSVTDQLTGLFNRGKLDSELHKEISRFNRYGNAVSVMLMDIDHFKSVNDNYGHQQGDQVLVEVAKVLKDHSREVDVVGRWGGEEFMIVCPETDAEKAVLIAEKLRAELESMEFEQGLVITGSFGVSEIMTNEDETGLMQRADQALYKAKNDGRNRVVLL